MTRPQLLGIAAAVLAAGAGAGLVLSLPAGSAEITLRPDEVFQELTGWETTTGVPESAVEPFWGDAKDEMLDRVVDEIGINRVRMGLRSGSESRTSAASRFIAGEIEYEAYKAVSYDIENDNDDPFVIDPAGFDFAYLDWQFSNTVLPLKERLEARGERLVISINYVGFKKGASVHDDPEEYAEFVQATYRHVRDTFGIVPDLWEVMLEPDLLENNWDGRQLGEAMVAAAKRLEADGFRPAFVAPSVTDMYNAVPYSDGIASVPGAMDHWVELSYHRYRNASRRNLRAIAAFAGTHGLKTSMLEYWFGKGNEAALRQDLLIGNVSAFQGRVLSGYHDFNKAADGSITLVTRPDARTTALYFGAGRLGWHRIGAESTAEDTFGPIAFASPDGRASVVIHAANAGKVTVNGLPAGRYRVRFVPEGKAEAPQTELEVGSSPLKLDIPGAGVFAVSPLSPG